MAFTLLDIDRIIAQMRRRLRLLELQNGSGTISTGELADRPTPQTLSPGTTVSYYATDVQKLFIWNVATEDWDEVTLS